jgi:hypothetical protein
VRVSRGVRRIGAVVVAALALAGLLVLAPERPAAAGMAEDVASASSYAQSRGGQVGIAVLDRDTGQWYENGGLAHTRMRSASVPKVLVAESLLDRSRRGVITLSANDRRLMESMIIGSDDAAMSSLYSRFGGLSMVTSVVNKYGLSEIGGPPTAGYWGMFQITAHDIVKFYDGMLDGGLQPADRDYLVSLMRRATPRGTDGFDQYFGIPRGLPDQAWGIKQGWMCCQEGQRRLHTTGILGSDSRYLVAVLSQVPNSRSYAYSAETLTRVVQLLFPGGVIPPSEVGNNPRGSLDGVADAAGGLRVTGWAGDPDAPRDPVDVHLYVDGRYAAVTRAQVERPDVGAALPDYGSRHGFDVVVGMPDGEHTVCAYAINVVKGTRNPLLGCRHGTVRSGPVGAVDAAGVEGLRTVAMRGWTLDRDRPATATEVHLYVDGAWGGAVRAAEDRPDIAAAFPGAGAGHGWSARIDLGSPGRHQVCAYGINVAGTPGANPLLGCRTVQAPTAMLGGIDGLSAPVGGTVVRGWAIDPVTPRSQVQVHVYVDGGYAGFQRAGRVRADVGAAYPEAGAEHGFHITLSLAPGPHRVCAYGIYEDGRAANPTLGCGTVG